MVFESNGVKITYRVFGSGKPLILLNGGPGRSSDSFTPLAKTLQTVTQRQVILFDQRGTGKSMVSPLDETTISLDLMVSDLEELRKHLGHKQIALLGHSFGGMYAMAYATKYPNKVEALVLSCSGGIDLSWQRYAQHNMLSRISKEAREKYEFWTSPAQTEKDSLKASLEALRVLIPAYVYNQKFVPDIEKDLVNLSYYVPKVNQLVWESMKDFNLKDAFEFYKARTLIIDGRQDILGEAVPITIHRTIKNSKLEFLDETSHYPWLDKPKEYFSLIKAFLS